MKITVRRDDFSDSGIFSVLNDSFNVGFDVQEVGGGGGGGAIGDEKKEEKPPTKKKHNGGKGAKKNN